MVEYNFCPKCGGKVNQNSGVVKCNSCNHTVYLHSAATGSIFVIKNNHVMMARRAADPFKGAWDIPGGFLHFGEDPKDGAIRELKEETGMNVKITHLLGIYMDNYPFQNEVIPTLNSIYVGRTKSGKPKPNDDIDEIKWFDISKPIQGIAFPAVRKALKDLKRWYENKL